MLRLENIQIRRDGFSLGGTVEIAKGMHVAVLGPSGAGKSTLLDAVGGFVELAEGRIVIDGGDVTRAPPGDRGVAVLFQDHNLFPHLTAWQNVALGLRPSLRLSAAEGATVSSALAQVGLDGFETRRPGELSGGQQGRVGLARALVQAKPVLLLDEAFAALGPALKAEMLALLGEVLRGRDTTLLMVTHDPQDARALCPQTLIVAEGEITGPFDTEAVLADPPAALADYLGQNGNGAPRGTRR